MYECGVSNKDQMSLILSFVDAYNKLTEEKILEMYNGYIDEQYLSEEELKERFN